VPAPRGGLPMAWYTAAERRAGEVVRRVLVGAPLPEGPAAGAGDPVRQLEAIAAALDTGALPASSRPYVEVIREAVRRLERSGAGDGASIRTAHAPR